MNDEYIELSKVLVGNEKLKLQILYKNKGILAVEKPKNILIDAYPWFPAVDSIIYNLKEEVARGKLKDFQFQNIYGIYALEPEVTGVALIATDKESMTYLRNEFGSDKMIFKFILISKGTAKGDSMICELPVAKHSRENRVLVSNKTGKKSKTEFKLLASQGGYQIWEAQTTYLRMHQIRLHAMECGIVILGEKLYKTGQAGRDDVCETDDLFLHLRSVEWDSDSNIKICSSVPINMGEFLSKQFPEYNLL